MTIRSSGFLALAIALAVVCGVHAQESQPEPDATGEYRHGSGKVCLWSSFSTGAYLDMAFEGFEGRIYTQDLEDSIVSGPFRWRVEHANGSITTSSQSSAEDATSSLCGYLIAAHERAEESTGRDRNGWFTDLLESVRRNR